MTPSEQTQAALDALRRCAYFQPELLRQIKAQLEAQEFSVFTPKELARLEFVRWLYQNERISG